MPCSWHTEELLTKELLRRCCIWLVKFVNHLPIFPGMPFCQSEVGVFPGLLQSGSLVRVRTSRWWWLFCRRVIMFAMFLTEVAGILQNIARQILLLTWNSLHILTQLKEKEILSNLYIIRVLIICRTFSFSIKDKVRVYCKFGWLCMKIVV